MPGPQTVTIVGDGLSGSLLALKLAAASSAMTVQLVGDSAEAGGGIAYGRGGAPHLLNAPASRMEVGLKPRFTDWLAPRRDTLDAALAESAGTLAEAFVPRRLFGDYIAERLRDGLATLPNLRLIRGHAVAMRDKPRALLLDDGRALATDRLVLATGHLPPALPFPAHPSPRIVTDPWSAWPVIAPDATIVLAGTGLTMVDVILSLRADGHRGRIYAISRHGLLPHAHRGGGAWKDAPVTAGATPRQALGAVRNAVRAAQAADIPWQRVFDALRPAVASIWHHWPVRERKRFLRHLRAPWDIHRHRMAARIADGIADLRRDGTLTVGAGRIIACDAGRDGLTLMVRPRGGRPRLLDADVLINCTGPGMDPRRGGSPLLSDLIAQGLGRGDPLGLGLESEDCTLIDGRGRPSPWLYAVGGLTRPAWWEIIAVPEINAQIDRLVARLATGQAARTAPLHAVFLDLGAGI